MKYPRASTEPLEIIRINECDANPGLATARFQALWNEMEARFTKEDIEAWLSAEGKRAEASDWAEAYKFGFTQGLVAVMARMDDELKRRRAAV